MDMQKALGGQYRAGLAMVRQCIERCPDEFWIEGEHPRTFWRIAYHVLFYTQLYLMPTDSSFVPWEKHLWHGPVLWLDDEDGVPPQEHPYRQADLIEYADFLSSKVDEYLSEIDLSSPTSGFSWYPIPKLDHQLVNIRHLGIHIGQLQERLFAVGIDTDWVGRR